MGASSQFEDDSRPTVDNRKPGHRFFAEHSLCFGRGGLAGFAKSTTEKGHAGALRPIIGWLRKNPGHSGKLGRIPLAKWVELWSGEAPATAKRYQNQLRKHHFIRRITHQHEPYIELAYWDTDVEVAHMAAKKARRLEADRKRFNQTPRVKKDQVDPSTSAETHERCHTSHLSDSRSHVETPVSRLRPHALSEGLTQIDFDRAEHNLPPVFSSKQIQSIQQSAQPTPTTSKTPPKPLENVPETRIQPARKEAVGAAHAAVGPCFNFDPRSGLSLTEQMLAWAANRTPRPELEVVEEPTRPSTNLGYRPKESTKPKVLTAKEHLIHAVCYVNAQFNMKLDTMKVLASKVSASSLIDAAYWTSLRHAKEPFECLEAAVMHSALQREKGLWGAKAA